MAQQTLNEALRKVFYAYLDHIKSVAEDCREPFLAAYPSLTASGANAASNRALVDSLRKEAFDAVEKNMKVRQEQAWSATWF